MGYLSDADRQLLPLALRQNLGFHHATEWYLRGWRPLSYGFVFHQAPQKNTTFLGGIASGKTQTAAASLVMDCLSIPYFRALSTSVTAKQAELGFNMFLAWLEGNDKLEHLVYDIKLRPWPIVYFTNFSEWESRTAGVDARFIRGFEYDRAVYDEAGLDFLGETVKILRGRLRGTRPDMTKRMSRLDVITSPTDAPWLRERYERGLKDGEKASLARYLSLKVRTRDNTHLTSEQIELIAEEYTEEMIAVEMDAEFPDYGMSMFPKRHINACTNQALNDLAYIALNPEDNSAPKKGWVVEEHPRFGITKFEMPYDPNCVYIMAGDPGTDGPPKRNAGCIGVLNDTKGQLAYFHWVDGKGSYNPFLESFRYAMQKYRPYTKLLDTTGTQSAMQELAFTNLGIMTDGVNFSNLKNAALNHLSMAISNHELHWPVIKGLIKQLSNYTYESDKKKFPQDIVMMLAMLAYGKSYVPAEEPAEKPSVAWMIRHLRTNSSRRR